MLDLAIQEKRFFENFGAIQMLAIQNQILDKEMESNVYISKSMVSSATTQNSQTFTNSQELVVANSMAQKNPHLLFYVTLDTPQIDVRSWLVPLGYVENGSHTQGSPDIVVIDPITKTFKFFDVKFCSVANLQKYFPFCHGSQFAIFLGRMSEQDYNQVLEELHHYHIAALQSYLNDPTISMLDKKEIALLLKQILSSKHSAITSIDLMLSKTSVLVVTD